MGGPERELLADALKGDLDALSELLEQMGPRVRATLSIAPKWQSVLEPDDIMQVTYMEAYLRIGRFQGDAPDKFLAWLRQIARNNMLDAIKELERDKRPPPERRITEPNSEASYAALLDVVGVTTSTPSQAAAGHEMRRHIDQTLGQLPPDYAKAIRLFDLEGRSGPEVAKAVGKSRGAAFMLLARARQRFAEIIGTESQFFSRAH